MHARKLISTNNYPALCTYAAAEDAFHRIICSLTARESFTYLLHPAWLVQRRIRLWRSTSARAAFGTCSMSSSCTKRRFSAAAAQK
eukprot:6199969-Pleurochrysis_carterae.AAC.1